MRSLRCRGSALPIAAAMLRSGRAHARALSHAAAAPYLAVQHMMERGEGKVLITSSVVSTIPGTFSAVYGASKAFTHSFAEALRNELDTNITVTSLRPGATDTTR